MYEMVKEKRGIKIRRSIRSIWHIVLHTKILQPLVKVFYCTYPFYLIRFIIDKMCHYCLDSRVYFQNNKTRVENIKSKLADDRSRLIYESMINFRCTHNPKYTYRKGIVDKTQYFDKDIIKLGDKEVYVDCGACNGDTIKAFLRNLQRDCGRFKEIIAIEPDLHHIEEINDWLLTL